eukprot:CAMPEP_0185541040 /NCGR_PEP_ID=MMETSP1381-20130426/1714_1 /TAXON_ID=298111 /ORGANISM="Pavlova sp., Strain CCMP459" /LENGTH=132 /DNA_ID=CAMNT_0028152937 /DNA_START=296 /DNA_END=691 /DNA_ORIENTATION=+
MWCLVPSMRHLIHAGIHQRVLLVLPGALSRGGGAGDADTSSSADPLSGAGLGCSTLMPRCLHDARWAWSSPPDSSSLETPGSTVTMAVPRDAAAFTTPQVPTWGARWRVSCCCSSTSSSSSSMATTTRVAPR